MMHAPMDSEKVDACADLSREIHDSLSPEEAMRLHGRQCLSQQYRLGDLDCPHCRARTQRRSSAAVSDTLRSILYLCTNPACAHSFVAFLTYEYGLSPSGIPKQGINLPMRPSLRIKGVTVVDPHQPPKQEPDPDQMTMFGD